MSKAPIVNAVGEQGSQERTPYVMNGVREDILKNGITNVFNQDMVLTLTTHNLQMELKFSSDKVKKLVWVDT